MKQPSVIKSVESKMNISDPVLIAAITRWKKDDIGFAVKEDGYSPEGFEKIYWSSVLSKINGNVEIIFITAPDEKINHLSIPFSSWFLFSCVKNNKEDYKIGWAISLS